MSDGPRGWVRPLHERVLDALAVGPGTALLDLGCGTGELAARAGARGATVTGVDRDPAAVAEAAATVPAGRFLVSDLHALPEPDAGYDAVTLVQVLAHVTNPLKVLREAARVVRPGGAVAVTVWGRPEECDVRAFGAALAGIVPGADAVPERSVGPPPVTAPGRPAKLAGLAGLVARAEGEVRCPFAYPDEDALVEAVLASGLGRAAAQRAGPRAVRSALRVGLSGFRDGRGGYRLENLFRYLVAVRPLHPAERPGTD